MFHLIYHVAVFIGYITTILLIAYLVLLGISMLRKDEVSDANSNVISDNMPILQPIPIPTANQESTIDKIIAWVFSVRKWQVMEAFEYEDKEKNVIYVIPAGFVFDGASIPRVLWAVLSPVGLLLIPGLLHDFGYKYDGIYVKEEADAQPKWSTDIKGKEAWDNLFEKVGNEVNGIDVLNAIATFGLYIGGFAAWNNWRDQKEPQPEMLYRVKAQETTPNTTDKPLVKSTPANEKHNVQASPVNEGLLDLQSDEKVTDKKQQAKVKAATKTKQSDKSTKKDLPKKAKTNTSNNTKKSEFELVSGTTKNTKIGAVNENQQTVLGKIVSDDESLKNVYKVQCDNCKNIYGVKSTSVSKAKCPSCQDGKPGIEGV